VRWVEIVNLTRRHKDLFFIARIIKSLVNRKEQKEEEAFIDKYLKEKFKMQKRKRKQLRQKKSLVQKARRNLNKYMPMGIIWMLRICLGFQAYMYNNGLGLLHLSWVLLSFI
jgi:hypothetical protein